MRMALPSLREAINAVAVLAGVTLIAWRVIIIADSSTEMVIVSVGVVMIYLGVWGLVSHLLPNRRLYTQLRLEVDSFIEIVRRLNNHAVHGETSGVESTKTELKASIDRIVAAAGVTNRV
jgi:hypothetical protein